MKGLEKIRQKMIAVISPDGALEEADFRRLSEEIDPYIASNGRLTGLMIRVRSFPGWSSFGALISHLRFVRDHHRKIGRIAALTDDQLLKIMPSIASHFVAAEIRQFPSDQEAQALAWLQDGGAAAQEGS
jgi:hypothetical protein